MKKRGLGAEYWNGFGGSVEKGERIEEAAIREVKEESRLIPLKLEKKGFINFHFKGEKKKPQVHLFLVKDYKGKERETAEMKPKWFDLDKIPYNKMWPADKIWMPKVLKGEEVYGDVFFKDLKTLVSYKLREKVEI